MDATIRPATNKEVKRIAREHAREMIRLHNSIRSVAVTAAKLTEVLDRADGAPFAGGQRVNRGEVAMAQLDRAYKAVVALFDDL